jgi:hypothetical protein
MKNISEAELDSWIPLFLNGRLDAEERQRFEVWLSSDADARQQLESWRAIQAAVTGQTRQPPPHSVWMELLSEIDIDHQRSEPRPRSRFSTISLISGIAFSLIVFLALWLVIRPGILLRWTVSGPAPISYRIYRAPAQTAEFVLVGQVQGKTGVQEYRYMDSLFIPGLAYTYRVEGVGEAELTLFDQVVEGKTAGVLPGQLAILVASALVGLLAAELIRQRTGDEYLIRWSRL